MNIIKYLKKAGVTVKTVTHDTITIKYNESNEHILSIIDMERYLFICLLDYIKEETEKETHE
jgi:hypothetical protein